MRLSAAILLVFLTTCSSFASEIKANIISVVDGSTVIIDTETGHKTIHIAGYRSPEFGQPYFAKAKALLEKIINNKPVSVKYLHGHDDIAKLTPANYKDIPISFIANGLGWTTKTSNMTLKRLQERAKLNKKGLWANYDMYNDFKVRKKNKPIKSTTIHTQNRKSSLYGISAADIPRDSDGTAVGDGGNWLAANKTYNQTGSTQKLPPLEIAGDDAPVTNSFWDGSVAQVERWLDKNLKDPDSFDAIEWSKVFKTALPTTPYGVRCKYRARNSFGGMNIYHQVFYMNKNGGIVRYTDL